MLIWARQIDFHHGLLAPGPGLVGTKTPCGYPFKSMPPIVSIVKHSVRSGRAAELTNRHGRMHHVAMIWSPLTHSHRRHRAGAGGFTGGTSAICTA